MAEHQNELFKEFIDREIQAMDIFLFAKASRASINLEEYIKSRLTLGASKESIESELRKDLEEGGRIFGEFRSAIKATTNGIINRSRDNALFADVGIDEEEYRWVAVLVNTCPDCLDRHGVAKTYPQWEQEGLPRSGVTVCKENCRCMLLPASTAIIDPIKRDKR